MHSLWFECGLLLSLAVGWCLLALELLMFFKVGSMIAMFADVAVVL